MWALGMDEQLSNSEDLREPNPTGLVGDQPLGVRHRHLIEELRALLDHGSGCSSSPLGCAARVHPQQ